MERYFIMILNNALTVSVLIFAVIVLRLLFQKAPKRLICFLWVIVAVKLIVPVPLESGHRCECDSGISARRYHSLDHRSVWNACLYSGH